MAADDCPEDRRPDDAAQGSRWTAPAWCAGGRYWSATLREPLTPAERAHGIPAAAYGPTLAACVAEMARLDRLHKRRALLAQGPRVRVDAGGWVSGPCEDAPEVPPAV